MALIKKGAEAEIHLARWMGRKVIQKRRVVKNYRLKEMDEEIRRRRTKKEASLIVEARKAGVSTPIVYDIDLNKAEITMQYLEHPRMKDVLDEMEEGKKKEICGEVGENIAKMHKKGIIHGDITTSNLILGDKIYFIDFGLGETDSSIEARGVDLHVLMEALDASLHPECFEWVFEGYEREMGKEAEMVKEKVEEIIKRGRYL